MRHGGEQEDAARARRLNLPRPPQPDPSALRAGDVELIDEAKRLRSEQAERQIECDDARESLAPIDVVDVLRGYLRPSERLYLTVRGSAHSLIAGDRARAWSYVLAPLLDSASINPLRHGTVQLDSSGVTTLGDAEAPPLEPLNERELASLGPDAAVGALGQMDGLDHARAQALMTFWMARCALQEATWTARQHLTRVQRLERDLRQQFRDAVRTTGACDGLTQCSYNLISRCVIGRRVWYEPTQQQIASEMAERREISDLRLYRLALAISAVSAAEHMLEWDWAVSFRLETIPVD